MRTPQTIKHEFVEFIPRERQEGVLYVSIPCATAVHSCFCGCGQKVVTPLSPAHWQLTFDGETISLWPSVGSWSYSCRSHYFIKRDEVVWAGDMPKDKIASGRARDAAARTAHFDEVVQPITPPSVAPKRQSRKKGFLNRIFGK